MKNISHHCPITAAPINYLVEEVKKDFFVIKSHDPSILKGLKCTGNLARSAVIGLALAITFLAVPLLLLADGVFIIARKLGCRDVTHHSDFHFLFTSSVFNTFIEKLKEHVNSIKDEFCELANKQADVLLPFEKNTIDIINKILGIQKSTNEDTNRRTHQDILDKLRALIKEKHSNNELSAKASDFIERICEFLYVGTNLMSEIKDFFFQQISAEQITKLENINVSEIPEWINGQHESLSRQAKFNGIIEVPRLYDPHYLGDIPTVLYHYPLATGKNIHIVRTPVIVKDNRRNKEGFVDQGQVVSEFCGFMDRYRKQNKVHLYINLMDRQARSELFRTQCVLIRQLYSRLLHRRQISR